MAKRTNLRLMAMAVMVVLIGGGSVWAFSGNGSGTQAEPYIITDVYQLQEMQDDLDAYYILGNDIDASDTAAWNGGAGFEPVGDATNWFAGVFDGRGYTITNLYINRPTTDLVGLVGVIKNGALVKNVGLENANVTGKRNSGTLVGASNGATLSNSWATGNITGSHDYQMRLGGLIGISSGANSFVKRCFADVTVTANGGAHQVGGLAGYNGHGSVMSDCYATGNVSGRLKVGGLVGDNPYPEGGYITRCYSVGHVSGSGGGLIGYNYLGGKTYDSYWDVNTSGKTSSKGGTGKTTTQMMQEATFASWDFVEIWDIVENETYPFLRPLIKPITIALDIKPGSCPNPLNLNSKGVLPVAILGTEDFDVTTIDSASVFLEGVGPIRSSYEDVSTPVSNGNECECSEQGPDGYIDLILKFRTQDIVKELINLQGQLERGQELVLTLDSELFDGGAVRGTDCVKLVGNVSKWLEAKRWDANGDGIVNFLDLTELANYWLESE